MPQLLAGGYGPFARFTCSKEGCSTVFLQWVNVKGLTDEQLPVNCEWVDTRNCKRTPMCDKCDEEGYSVWTSSDSD